MRGILIFQYLAILIKDTLGVGLGGPYLLRGIAQGAALVTGSFWLIKASTVRLGELRKYTSLGLYFTAIALSTIQSAEKLYSIGQFISLIAICLFFIAYHEINSQNVDRDRTMTNCVIFSSIIWFAASLFVARRWPHLGYLVEWDGVHRLRGIFNSPALLCSISGAAIGLSLCSKNKWFVKATVVCLGSVCMALSLTRTFWFATLVALAFVAIVAYRGKHLKWAMISAYCLLLMVVVAYAAGINVTRKEVGVALRTESFANLSGRTLVWETAVSLLLQRPVLGYGFATGYQAFQQASHSGRDDLSKLEKKRYTLHNGYVQALLDSGLLGAIFYIVVLAISLRNLIFYRRPEQYGALYMMIYIIIGNLGLSSVFDASQENSILAWYFVVSGLSIGRIKLPQGTSNEGTSKLPPT